MDLLVALDAANQLACDRVAEIKPEQWDLLTPCEEWTVGGVALHLAIEINAYDAMLANEWPPEVQERISTLTITQATAASMVEEGSLRLRARFREPDALTRLVSYPIEGFTGENLLHFSVFECCIHSWDIAQALGVDGTFSEDLAQIGYDGALPFLDRIYGSGLVKRPITDEPTGSAQVRLLHLFGR